MKLILISILVILSFAAWDSIDMTTYSLMSVDLNFFESEGTSSWDDGNDIQVTLSFPDGIPYDSTIWKDNDNEGWETDFADWEEDP